MSAGKSALRGRMDATAFVPVAEIMFHLSADQKSYFSQRRQRGNAISDSFYGLSKQAQLSKTLMQSLFLWKSVQRLRVKISFDQDSMGLTGISAGFLMERPSRQSCNCIFKCLCPPASC